MVHSPKIDYYRTRDFSEKLNLTFVYLRENAWPYLRVQFLIAGPLLLLVNLFSTQMQYEMFDTLNDDTPDGFFANALDMYGLTILSVIITGSIIASLTYSYMNVYQHKSPESISVANVTSGFGKRYFYMLIYAVMSMVVIIIGMFFFIVPGVYLAIVLSLGACIIVFEGKDPFTAFGRSFTLIKDNWFLTAGLVIIVFIIAYFVNFVFSVPKAIMMLFYTSTVLENGTSSSDLPLWMQVLDVVFAVFQSFASILTFSLIYITVAFQYFNIIESVESRGLMARIENMDKQPDEEEGEIY